MSTANRKRQVVAALSVLLLLAFAAGCRGFFVNPTLTAITVTPVTPSIVQGNTRQMTATGSYDGGSPAKDITGSVDWSTSDANIATVSSGGLVTGVKAGSATITASKGTISGGTTVGVTVANLVSIAVTPTNFSLTSGQTQQYTATGTLSGGGTQDITTSVSWSTDDTTTATVSNASGSQGLLTAQTVTATKTIKVIATSGTVSGNTNLTVNP
jgi:hypothetical protein